MRRPNDFSLLYGIFRPRDTFINSAVGEGYRTYYFHEDGAYNGFEQSPLSPLIKTEKMRLRPLKDFITSPVDFLNIDCEGMDMKILQSHDWKIRPTIIAVEGEAGVFLREMGYELMGMTGLTKIYKKSN